MLIATSDCRWIRVDDADGDLVRLDISGDAPCVTTVKRDGSLTTIPVRCIVAARKLGRPLEPGERVYTIDFDRRNLTRENLRI